VLSCFHKAIEKDLDRVLELMGSMPHEEMDQHFIGNLLGRLKFLSSVCAYHAKAEEDVIFPAIAERGCPSIYEECGHGEVRAREWGPFFYMSRVLAEVQSLMRRRVSGDVLQARLKGLVEGLHDIRNEMVGHMKEEETALIPRLVETFQTVPAQCGLMWTSLKVMPMRLLRQVLPWASLPMSEEQVQSMLHFLRVGASAEGDEALLEDLVGAILKRRAAVQSEDQPGAPTPGTASGGLEDREAGRKRLRAPEGGLSAADGGDAKKPQLRREELAAAGRGESGELSRRTGAGGGEGVGSGTSGRAPEEVSAAGREACDPVQHPTLGTSKASPIDLIFRFHDALRAELKLFRSDTKHFVKQVRASFPGDQRVDIPSLGKLASSLGALKTRFLFLWGIYSAHSKAEDEVVFPALESKDMQSGVCHSYELDHEQEERLFAQLADMVQKVEQNVEALPRPSDYPSPGDAVLSEEEARAVNLVVLQAGKLHAMIAAVYTSLEAHVTSEERNLWPLFVENFSHGEQEEIVGYIIGRTGAEVLQKMLKLMIETMGDQQDGNHALAPAISSLKSSSRKTMFEHWLKSELGDSTPGGLEKAVDERGGPRGPIPPAAPGDDGAQPEAGMYHPNWAHVFKLNQKELHAQVRMVANDPNVDPRKKRYIMQNMMASRWILSQNHDTDILQKAELPPDAAGAALTPSRGREGAGPGEPNGKGAAAETEHHRTFAPDGRLGCKHYRRGSALVFPCCNQVFTCRHCHDEACDHEADRYAVQEMVCMHCGERQPPEKQCRSCQRELGSYFCKICRFTDDDKSNHTYHCPYCNVCRRGRGLGIDFYHCMKTNQCLSLELSVPDSARERPNLEGCCPICHDKLDSTRSLKELPCGHLLHSDCFKCYVEHGSYKCPVCSKSIGNMTIFWRMLDAKLAGEVGQMPPEDANRTSRILCNDCGEKSTAPFHYVYHKCLPCGSYNTQAL